MPNTFATPVGIDHTARYQLRSSDDAVVTTFTGDEPLDGYVWRGKDQPILFAPTVTWEDPTQGLILATFLGTDTANLEAGKYQVRLLVDGQPAGQDSILALSASPGSAPALWAYCTADDMYDYFSDMKDILDENDLTNFGRQRAKARTWTDRVIQANRRNSISCGGVGYSGGFYYAGSWGFNSPQQNDPILQGYLDAGKLMLTSQVIEMNAKMSLAYACEGEIGPDDKATAWQQMAAKYRAEAEALACSLVAQIDLNGDGYAEITINCGMASNR